MNSGSHPHLRYIPDQGPAGAGVLDRTAQRFFPRDYTAQERLDLVAWLNERHAGYPAVHGALKG